MMKMRLSLFMATQWSGLGQGKALKKLDRLGKIITTVS